MENSIPPYLQQSSPPGPFKGKGARFTFLEKTVYNTAKAVKSIYLQAESADNANFMRRISPSVKFVSLIYFVIVISISHSLQAQVAATVYIFSLFLLARLNIAEVYRKIFLLAFIFGFIVVLPASLNAITPGNIVFPVISFNRPVHFWIYNIPQDIGITDNGIRVVALVFLRVLNSVSFAMLVVFTTPFPSFIKSFKLIGVPDAFLMIIFLAYKYIFILSRTIEETFFALKSRLSGNIRSKNLRRLAGGRIFYIYKRSHAIYEGTYYAMISRGYHGKMKLTASTHLNYPDIISLAVVILMGIVIILI